MPNYVSGLQTEKKKSKGPKHFPAIFLSFTDTGPSKGWTKIMKYFNFV